MFERLGSSLRNSKKMFQDNLAIGFVLFTLVYTLQFITQSNIGSTLISIMTIYLIVDHFYTEEKVAKTLLSFLKLLGFGIILGIAYVIIFVVPFVLIMLVEVKLIEIFSLIILFAIIIFALIVSISLFFVPYYIVDGFSIVESIKYSWKSVNDYDLHLQIIGAMVFFSFLTFLTIMSITFVALLHSMFFIGNNSMLLLIFFGLIIGAILGVINFRITTWTVQYGIDLYEDVNEIAL